MNHSDYVAGVLVAVISGSLAVFVSTISIYILFQFAPTERQKRARSFSDWLWLQWKREFKERQKEEARAREEEARNSGSAPVDEERGSSSG